MGGVADPGSAPDPAPAEASLDGWGTPSIHTVWGGRVLHLLGAGVAILLLLAACRSDAPADTAAPDLRAGRVATLAELVGPWRREPLIIDPNVRAAADRACRADSEFPAGLALVGVDARGGGRLITAYAGPGGATADCTYIKVGPNGAITGSLSSTGKGGGFAPLAPGQLESHGGGAFSDDTVTVQYVIGRVGAGTARVMLEVEGVGPVTASLGQGWYIAWWEAGRPLDQNGPGPHLPSKRYTVAAFDALGQITDQATE